MDKISNLPQTPPLQQTAVVRSASEIELRLNNLKLDQSDCKKWYDDAYAKYESDRKYWGRGEADPTEYLEANRQLVELNVQIKKIQREDSMNTQSHQWLKQEQ